MLPWDTCPTRVRCGDGVVDQKRKEQCEDKNQLDGDGCDKDCSFAEILQLVAGDDEKLTSEGPVPIL